MLSIFFFIFFILLYLITSAGNTPYDYFTRLAKAFLDGNIYIKNPPYWLNELIPVDGNKFYVPYPPMPAFISTPFVLLSKGMIKQQQIAHIIAAAIPALNVKLAFNLKKGRSIALFVGILSGAGTIIWHLASVGSSWYFGQITAAFFLTLSLVEVFGKKRPFLIGVLLGASYLSRIQVILSLPLFLYLLKDGRNIKPYVNFVMGIIPFFAFNSFYNYVRFGVFWDKGYALIPGVLDEPWYQKGIFDISYIPRNLKAMFWSFPKFINKPPFLIPSWYSTAIWITTPAFILSLMSPIKKAITKVAWLSVFLVSIPIITHGGVGFTQFGYRYAFDYYPILFLLIILGFKNKKPKKLHYMLLIISVLVNAWGVILINKFGLFTY
jgi:hypothetical protein